jgi:hypothetical protein
MKRTIFIALGILVILIVILGVVFFIRIAMHPATPQPVTENPFASSTNTTGGNISGPSLPVTLTDGSRVAVPDFTKTPQPDWAGASAGYQVSGSEHADYQILFYPDNSGFLISILKEPLGQSRLEAEKALRETLKLSDAQLCKLSSQVSTSISVNEQYAGQDLGLSFCPGATKLP